MRQGIWTALLAASLTVVGSFASAQQPIVFGLITPLTPPSDTVSGQLVKRGAELGVDYINEHGGILGRKVALSVYDSNGRNETGVAAYRRLVTNEKAVAVFGFVHSGVNIAVNEVAKELGVPTMAAQASAADVTAKNYDIAFRTHAVDVPRAATWLGWAKKMGYKRLSLVAETTDFGLGLVKQTEIQNKAQNLGIELQSVTFDRTTTDLMPQLLTVKAFKPDAIVNIGSGAGIDLMISQATTLGLLPSTPMVTAYDYPTSPQFWKIHGDKGVGIHFLAFYTPASKLSDLGEWFVKRYKEKFNEPPLYQALAGFTNAVVFAQAIELAKTTEPKALIKALETGAFKGWSATPVTLPRAEGVLWHNWSPPLLIVKYTKQNQTAFDAPVVYTLGE